MWELYITRREAMSLRGSLNCRGEPGARPRSFDGPSRPIPGPPENRPNSSEGSSGRPRLEWSETRTPLRASLDSP